MLRGTPLPLALLSACALAQQANDATGSRFRRVESYHASFEYSLPASWKKDASNSYRGPNGSLIEQIYPPAIITPEYCASGLIGPDPFDETRVYDNGNVRGCYRMSRHGKYREVSFDFPSPHGIEDISILMRVDEYQPTLVKKIIDSVRLKQTSH